MSQCCFRSKDEDIGFGFMMMYDNMKYWKNIGIKKEKTKSPLAWSAVLERPEHKYESKIMTSRTIMTIDECDDG